MKLLRALDRLDTFFLGRRPMTFEEYYITSAEAWVKMFAMVSGVHPISRGRTGE